MSAPVPTLYEWAGGSEAFGGPPLYTEKHGGYPQMLSKHHDAPVPHWGWGEAPPYTP